MKIDLNPKLKEQLVDFYKDHPVGVLASGGILSAAIAFLLVRSFLKKEPAKKKESLAGLSKIGFKIFLMLLTSSKSVELLKKADFLKSGISVE